MFETTVVESKKQKFGIQQLSDAAGLGRLHVIVVVGLVVGAIWNV